MSPRKTRRNSRFRYWLALTGVAAAIGSILSIGFPWVQTAVLGTRPYVTSAFDVGSFAGWVLMLVGLIGVYATFDDRFGRLGRTSVGVTAIGMLILSILLARRVVLFVAAGFRAVPATGEDPAGLPLSLLTILGFGLTLVGAGGLGLALRTVENRHPALPWLLLSASVVPLALIVVDLLVGLPLAVGRLLVATNAVLIPFGLGWLALGVTVWSRARFRD